MSEVVELKIEAMIVLKKEEVVEDVANKERQKITNLLEEEDMLWKNIRRIKRC